MVTVWGLFVHFYAIHLMYGGGNLSFRAKQTSVKKTLVLRNTMLYNGHTQMTSNICSWFIWESKQRLVYNINEIISDRSRLLL